MGVFDKPELLFTATPPDLKKFIGKWVEIPSHGPVKIKTIVGNLGKTLGTDKPKPMYYEINGKHLISMLRFHAQMEGAKDITEDQFRAFEDTEFVAEKLPPTMKELVDEQKKRIH